MFPIINQWNDEHIQRNKINYCHSIEQRISRYTIRFMSMHIQQLYICNKIYFLLPFTNLFLSSVYHMFVFKKKNLHKSNIFWLILKHVHLHLHISNTELAFARCKKKPYLHLTICRSVCSFSLYYNTHTIDSIFFIIVF